MSLYKSYTKVSVERTAAQMQGELAQMKATRIMTEYERAEPVAISFAIERNGVPPHFRLPIRVEQVGAAMKRSKSPGWNNPEHVKRVAWRIAYSWLQAQLAMVEVGMVETAEIFALYLQVDVDGTTLWQRMLRSNELKALPAPGEKR